MAQLTPRTVAWQREGEFAEIQGHKVFVLPGLGHYPQIEDPDAVYRAIERHASRPWHSS